MGPRRGAEHGGSVRVAVAGRERCEPQQSFDVERVERMSPGCEELVAERELGFVTATAQERGKPQVAVRHRELVRVLARARQVDSLAGATQPTSTTEMPTVMSAATQQTTPPMSARTSGPSRSATTRAARPSARAPVKPIWNG